MNHKTYLKFLFLLALSASGVAQTVLMPMPRQCFSDNLAAGQPLAGGKLFTYQSGTSIQQATYTDSGGLTQNTNPVILDAAGCATIWLTSGTAYRFLAQNSSGAQEWVTDQVSGLATTSATVSQALTTVTFSATPTFTAVAQYQVFRMTLTGNVTSSSMVMAGVTAPSIVTFELIQDGTGSRTFAWPANVVGASAVNSAPNSITSATFTWDGTSLYAVQYSVLNSNNVFTGSNSFLSINSRQMCDQFAGATFDVKVNACIAAVIAQGGGIADASGLLGAQSQSAEIDIGNAGGAPVTLLLADKLNDTVTMNIAGQCGFKLFNNSRIVGHSRGIGGGGTDSTIRSAVNTNTGSLLCNDSTGLYVAAAGITLYNPSGGTFTNGAMYINGAADGSNFQDMVVASYGGIGVHIRNSCCHANWGNFTIDGNHVANSEPLVVEELAGDATAEAAIAFDNISINHPGTGKSNIRLTNTLLSSSSGPAVTFYNLYMEGNNTDTTTPLIKDDGFQSLGLFGVIAQLRSVASSQHLLSLVNNTVGYRPQVVLKQFYFLNSGITCPYVAIDDVNYAFPIYTDSQCRITGYENRATWASGLAFTEGSAVSAEAVARSGNEVIYGDATAHCLMGAYNANSFFCLAQVITATSAPFATATTAATCVQSTTAVAGATTGMSVSVAPVSTPGVGAQWSGFVSSAGNVTINECAVAASAGGTIAFNIRVIP
jgi:hypothetical protein